MRIHDRLSAGLVGFGWLMALLLLGPIDGPRAATSDAEPLPQGEHETAVFAGGCFWCVESDFDHVPGVHRTVSGYTGGTTVDPTYKTVVAGRTGHREAVEITYDPARVSFEELLEIFWRTVDPTDGGGQFCDRGHSYTTAIFPTSEEQRRIAEASKQRLLASGVLGNSIETPVAPTAPFYPAEDYHQDYYEKNPLRYNFYRLTCGRDRRIESLWGDEAHRGIEKE